MRRFLTLLIALSILLVPTLAHGEEKPIRLFVGTGEVVADVPPVMEGGRTLVPVRALTEALGFQVTWDAATETATLTRESLTIQLTVGKQEALVNGQAVTMDVPAVHRDGRLLVPVRFVSEQLGYKVTWDPENRVVKVELPEAPKPEAPKPEAPKPIADPEALALLEKSEQFKNLKATGDFIVTVQGPMGTMDMNMAMEMYTKGEDNLLLSSITVFGATQKIGQAQYNGQTWALGPMGEGWVKTEAPTAPSGFDNPAAFAQLNEELLKFSQISRAEQSYEGKVYDVVTIKVDVVALAKLTGEEIPAGAQSELTMHLWLDKETGMQHHMDLSMTMQDEETAMKMAGTMFFEVWEQPIPFPAEILQ